MTDNSGPAFPREDYQGDNAPGQRGLSKRELFAAMICSGMMGNMEWMKDADVWLSDHGHSSGSLRGMIAQCSAQMADALLAELQK
jgi:hypothetical protein